MLTSIIIPSYNAAHMLHACIQSIRRYTPEPHEIIVVDNGSADRTWKVCAAARCKLIRFPVNRGFPAACNAGLRLAAGDYLMLLNNDVIVGANWLRNMQDCLTQEANAGIVGPYTNYASGVQQVSDVSYETVEQYMASSANWNHPDPSRRREVQRLVGFCMLFRRELMNEIGMLDERFTPGHFEDDDYCHRARLAGYRLLIAGDTFVHHHGSASFRKQPSRRLQQVLARNLEQFIAKWGFDPRTLIHN